MAYSNNLTRAEQKTLAKEKVDKALAKINTDVVSVFNNAELPKFLKFAANFHYFDIYNVLLIYKQRPTASFIASFRTWEKFSIENWGDPNRPVFSSSQKGKGIGILVPYILKKRSYVKDEAGQSKRKVVSYFDYHVVFVFDKEQTNGIPAPVFDWNISESPTDAEAVFNALKSKAPFDISFSNDIDAGYNFVFNNAGENAAVVDTLLLRMQDKNDFYKLCNNVINIFTLKILRDIEEKYSRDDFQKIVECVSYMLSCYFGLPTEQYVFFFASSWFKDSVADMINVLDVVQRAVHRIIEMLEEESMFFKSLYGDSNDAINNDDVFVFSNAFEF